jgi:hypothetical protein
MAVARFAWQQLGDKEKAQIAKILPNHPHYDIYLTTERPAHVTEVEWAFVRAATWPDWVRDAQGPGIDKAKREEIRRDYHKGPWHFVNLPYVHPEDAAAFDAAAIRKAALEPELDDKGEPRHALAGIKQCLQLLQAADTAPADKAVRLCWLLHLVGDVHQPLHCATLIATKITIGPFPPPHGDEGGNQLAVKVTPADPAPMVLHFYWDSLLFAKEPLFKAVDVRVNAWRSEGSFARDKLTELTATDFLAWADESLKLAQDVAYRGQGAFLKATPIPPHAKVDPRGFVDGLDAPRLPGGYNDAAERVAERRMVLAGYRLADQLTFLFGRSK